MSINRRQFVGYGSVAAGAAWLARAGQAAAQAGATAAPAPTGAAPPAPATVRARRSALRPVAPGGQLPVVTPNGSTLPWRVVGGVKIGHLVAEAVEHEFAPGMRAQCWGYNGGTPGPTIEAVEGDRLRIYVTNRLPEPTTVHWHGVLLPNGMDGVAGLNQRAIKVGETFMYEFVARHPGTFMYHPHFDEMTQ
ncbi:MAG TPA: multicopper oxidase domain-containing protein, partial [Polyangiaceae bacterium]|nr:multicopper oxidase domain-containing protein [Polyangiaceae bacterium]